MWHEVTVLGTMKAVFAKNPPCDRLHVPLGTAHFRERGGSSRPTNTSVKWAGMPCALPGALLARTPLEATKGLLPESRQVSIPVVDHRE
jgi:hypothetical protein